jgi:hypothetical protein
VSLVFSPHLFPGFLCAAFFFNTSTKNFMAKSNKKVLSVLNKKRLSIPEKKKLSTPEDDQLSIEIVKAFQKQALPISKQISSLRIDSQHDYELAEELLSKLKTMSKKAVKERKSMTGPLKQVIKKRH